MKYTVSTMTKKSYNAMMSGSMEYSVYTVEVEAESAKEARKIAKAKGMVVGEARPTVEIEAERAAIAEAAEKARIKAEAARARKIENDTRKAAEMGMTVERYKAYRNHLTTIRKYKKEIEELKAEIAKREAYIAKYERG